MRLKSFLFVVFCFTSSIITAFAQDNNVSAIDLSIAKFRIKDLSFNSANSDFGLFPFSENNFFFSSNRYNENGTNARQVYNWNNLPFLDIYLINKSGDTSFSSPIALPGSAESKYNEGPIFFDPSSSSFFITRNDFTKKKYQQSRNGINRLKIYIENIDGTSFKSFGEFQYNNNKYSVGHAALSKDGKRIYFSSDMPDGFGGADLYMCVKQGDTWGLPKNLGALINTPGNEMFPFVADDDKLYFSSNGHSATTGLDIYSAERNGEEYKNLSKLTAPFNSDQDDFSFYIYPDRKSGYFSSNRTGGKGDDDIYSFELDIPIIKGFVRDDKTGAGVRYAKARIMVDDLKITEITADSAGNFRYEAKWGNDYTIETGKDGYTSVTKSVTTSKDKSIFELKFDVTKEDYGVEGLVVNKDNNAPIPGATVSLIDKKTGKITTTTTDDKGNYNLSMKKNSDYTIKVDKLKFVDAIIPVSTQGMSIGTKKQNIFMEELVVGKSIKIDNVYYDLGKWDIRTDAKVELDKMVQLMNENPSMVIELSSHTDSRGSDESNLTLSDKRAKAVAAYMVSKGIASARVTGKGYGETKLLNACTNGVKCSEEEHQKNRRTEFKILKIQ